MDIQSPRYHDFKKCCDLKDTEQFLRAWEISVFSLSPYEDSLEWSIVMSHLTSANFGKDEEFKDRLIALCGQSNDFQNIKKCISSFNPFLNRYSCFFNKSLQKVVETFKDNLQKTKGKDNYISKIEESSLLLKSNIALINTTDNGDITTTDNFPKTDSEKTFETTITLYSLHCSDSEDSTRFNFGIKRDKGLELKKGAFLKILKQADILRNRGNTLFSLNKEGESFIISILKSDCISSIPNLYKSSYHAWKLIEAGFEMDPRVLDSNEFSALYHALTSGDEKYVYILHNYAANACHYSEKTFRDPDGFILDNLKSLGDIIANDKKKSNNFAELSEKSESVKVSAEQLIKYNDFLSVMCENIVEGQKVSDKDATEEVMEAMTRKNVILELLKTYNSFFFFDENGVTESNLFSLDNYSKYDTYYRNLDNSATLFFFDKIFYLKERLRLDNDEYSKLESAFFLSILSNKYFSSEIFQANLFVDKHSEYQRNFNDYLKSTLRSSEKKYFKFIPLLERLRLRQEVNCFIQTLSTIKIEESNILKRISNEEVLKTLASLPEVKDELMICRLIHYLQTALKQNVASIKQALIIERALQVLGETLVHGSQNRKSLCFLLFTSVPADIFRTLKQTRNILSHLNEYSYTPKLKAEKNNYLLSGIVTELRMIFGLMQGIFDIQQLRLAEFIFKRGLKEMNDNISSPGKRELVMSSSELSDALKHLELEYNKFSEIKSVPCNRNTIFKNPNILQNLIQVTDEKLQDENVWAEETILLENVKEILWPLKYLLIFIVKDCTIVNSNIRDNICLSEEILMYPPCQIKVIVEEFWEKYKNLVSELRITVNQQNTKNIGAIDKFKKILKGFVHLSEKEKHEIRSEISESVNDSINLKQQIQECLELEIPLTDEQISKFGDLFISGKSLKKLKKVFNTDPNKALELIKKADNPIDDLNSILDGSCMAMGKDELDKLCKRLEFSNDTKNRLTMLNVGQKPVAVENHLDILLNRVKLLKEILIHENPNIHELWNKAKNPKTKQYARHKIIQRYVRDPEVQTSVEMLLFDCMILLGKETDMQTLWIKASSLFSGINLRNVLGHGNPTLENIGKLLDPDDLPSVLVGEMLQLIQDEDAIQSMYEFSKQTDSDFNKFQVLINDEDNTEYFEIRKRITDCERWKIYSKLLPQNNIRNNASSNVSHSISVDCEECERISEK